jgi:intracellular septation protein A
MQWTSLGLVIAFGGASFLTHDPRFVMFKPTLVYAALGVAMLKRGWMTRYMTPAVLAFSADVAVAFGYVWAVMMFATAALNVWLVANGDLRIWAWFLGFFPMGSKLALFAVQYLTTRAVTVSRVRSAAETTLHRAAA